ncbi:hypothetical protein D3C72_1304820 [compost metagenome]
MQHLVQGLLDGHLIHPLAADLLQGLVAFQIQPLQLQVQVALRQRQGVALILQVEGRHLHLITAGERLGIVPRQLGGRAHPLQGDPDALRQGQGEGRQGRVAAGGEPDPADLGQIGAALEIRQHHVQLALCLMQRHPLPLEDHMAIALQIAAVGTGHGQEA